MVREEYNHSRPVSALIRDWLLYSKASGGGGILKTVTGNPISVSDALAAKIKSLTVSLSPIQEGSGDPSPVNIRPITGRTAVTVWREAVYDPSADPALTVQLGQTVYGGTVDVTGGKVHVTHELVDMSTIPWNPYAASTANVGKAYAYLVDISPGFKTPINDPNVRSTAFRYIGAGDIKRMALYDIGNTYSTSAYLYLHLYDGEYHTRAEWQAKLAEMDAKIVLPLAEPFDITLDPAPLSTLRGDNNVWSDGDSVEMTYKAVSS